MTSGPTPARDMIERQITLHVLLQAARNSWLAILIGSVAGVVLALLLAFSMKPIYRAVAVVMPVTDSAGGGTLARLAGQFGGLSAIAGIGLSGDASRDEAIAVLQSRSFGELVIGELNLVQVFFASRWNAESSAWKPDWRGRVPTAEDAWRFFDERVRSVNEDRDRGLVSLQIELGDPELASSVANYVIKRANEILRQKKIDELTKSLSYLEAELDRARQTGLEQAISRVMESQINERMLVSVRDEYSFRTIDPAVAADLKRPIRPQKALLAAYGGVVGALLGFAYAAWRRTRSRRPLQQSPTASRA